MFLCHLEETLSRIGLMPDLYKRYVDGTLAKMPGTETASAFLTALNGLHPQHGIYNLAPCQIPFIDIEGSFVWDH